MYKFPTVKEIIEQLEKFPPDAQVHVGFFSQFLDDNIKPTHGVITDKEAYTLYPADSVEYGEFYCDHRNSNPSGFSKIKCVIISTG